MDPAPFATRDLDPAAEAFIVEWAKEQPRRVPLALCVHLDEPPLDPHAVRVLSESINVFFNSRARATRGNLLALFTRGYVSLLIGLAFLAAALLTSEMLGEIAQPTRATKILRETLSIGGWVAMWRPLEIFLYDWWPILTDLRRFQRLGQMTVEVRSKGHHV